MLLVTAKSGTVDEPTATSAGRQLAQTLAAEPDVTDVVSYFEHRVAPSLRSEDAASGLVLAHIAGDEAQVTARSRHLIDTYAGDRGAVTVLAGGPAGINHDVTNQVTRSLAIAEAIAVPLTLLLLLFAFGSLVSALLPLAVGGVAILGTFAELYLLGSVTDVSIFAINLTTALGLGLGIDYALFIVSRFREQLAAGDDVPTAVGSDRGHGRPYGRLHRGRGDGRAGRAAGVPALLPALVRLRGHRCRRHRGAGCARVAAGAARRTRAPGQRRPRPVDPVGGPQPTRAVAVLGPAGPPRHAPAGADRAARDRAAARGRRPAARHHVRHSGPGRAAGSGGQPAGGRRARDALPRQRRRAHRRRDRRTGRSGSACAGTPVSSRCCRTWPRSDSVGTYRQGRPPRPPRRTRP